MLVALCSPTNGFQVGGHVAFIPATSSRGCQLHNFNPLAAVARHIHVSIREHCNLAVLSGQIDEIATLFLIVRGHVAGDRIHKHFHMVAWFAQSVNRVMERN